MLAVWYDWDPLAAERHFRRALELDPDSAEAHLYYAHLRSNQGRHEEALREAERALELEPFNSRFSALTGQFLVHAGRSDEAIARLQATIALDPNHVLARMFIATAYIEKEMYAEAIAEAQVAIDRTRRRMSHPLGMLGYALAKSGDVAQARAVLDELRGRLAVALRLALRRRARLQRAGRARRDLRVARARIRGARPQDEPAEGRSEVEQPARRPALRRTS